jgi:hypothetical protein
MPALAVELRCPGAPARLPLDERRGGKLIADGELTQKRKGDRLLVHAVWRFKDGLLAEEDDVLLTRPELSQESFRWVEHRGKDEVRRAEVDFRTGKASFSRIEDGKLKTWEEKLYLPRGKGFTGYEIELAASYLRGALRYKDARRSLTFVAFTPSHARSRDIARVRRASALPGELRPTCSRCTRRSLSAEHVANAADSHLWFTHALAPRSCARANLLEKDDPRIGSTSPRGRFPARRARETPR